MAHHALINLHDTSGYTPSQDYLDRLLAPARPYRKSKAYSKGASALSSRNLPHASVIDSSCTPCAPYFWQLSFEEIIEIEDSVRYFQRLNLPLNAISTQTFPLTARLRLGLIRVLEAIYGHHQFMILCGLDPSRYTDTQNVIIHAGLSSHIGNQRGLAGHEGGDDTAVHHIVAMIACPRGSTGQYHGPPNQAREIPFHTDNGDIVSLYTLSTSHTGGDFYLADSSAVYDDLKSLEPRLAKVLTDDWTMISPSPYKAFDKRPIAFPQHPSGRTLINCSRSRITGTPSSSRPSSLPPLTRTQKEALDALHYLAAGRAIEIKLQPGDMIFFNNLSMLHARDAFVDNDCVGRKRHLLRLILKNEEKAYKLPTQLEETWKGLYEHDIEEELFPVKSELFTFAASH